MVVEQAGRRGYVPRSSRPPKDLLADESSPSVDPGRSRMTTNEPGEDSPNHAPGVPWPRLVVHSIRSRQEYTSSEHG